MVIEHIPQNQLYKVADACYNYLRPNGKIIITVPHTLADKILNILKLLRMIKGLALQEHYGFNPEQLPYIFKQGKLIKKKRWELGLNYLHI